MELSRPTKFHVDVEDTPTTIVKIDRRLTLTNVVAVPLLIVQETLIDPNHNISERKRMWNKTIAEREKTKNQNKKDSLLL